MVSRASGLLKHAETRSKRTGCPVSQLHNLRQWDWHREASGVTWAHIIPAFTMPYPSRPDVEVPLLRVLLDLGGEAKPSEVYEPLAAQFPSMTAEERKAPRANGEPQWENDVRFARQELVDKGELDGSEYGVWKITPAGRARLESGVTSRPNPKWRHAAGLMSDDGLRKASQEIAGPAGWGAPGSDWVSRIGNTIRKVRDADERERGTLDFQRWLWNDNHIAAVGQGNIPIDRALQDPAFREWLAAESLKPLPDWPEEQMLFLTRLYEGLKERLSALRNKTPHLKIFRTIAALFPEAMTTVASPHALWRLVRAMGGDPGLHKAARHVWVRKRLDDVLGAPEATPEALAERMALPWILYERYAEERPEQVTVAPSSEGEEPRLLPLPAARRRRGLTAIKGLFPGTLSVLEFVQAGATRDELLDFLRASSPDSKAASLGVTINVYQSELDVIRRDEAGRYALTERGTDVLESQDSVHLADWLLTRVLGVDEAIVRLRQGPMAPSDLARALRRMNPAWTTDFVPQAIVSWLRSMEVIRTTPDWRYELTEAGQLWAAQIDWVPEALPGEEDPPPPPAPPPDEIRLPPLSQIVRQIQERGLFEEAQITSLHAGLWSHTKRHFSILTGLSGAGKTKLAMDYAKALTGDDTASRMLVLPVQPGWYDPGALLGFPNPLRPEAYVRPHFLEFLLRAVGDPARPYVVILDEMNLSHPEQYMAPLLSAMESDQPVPLHTEGDLLDGVPARVPYPANLVLIGTVNMDETTHGLSDKVLDRAFVLEFWKVDLELYRGWEDGGLPADASRLARQVLTELAGALEPARLHFGWRTVSDVMSYIRLVHQEGSSIQTALDAVVYAKVLPKLRGEDTPRLQAALKATEALLGRHGLRQSADKVRELHHDLVNTGSCRFWR